MEANEFVGFTLPVVNIGPWSYFSNGGNDGEDETMIVNGSLDGDGYLLIDETSKTIYDAIASGKTVIVKTEMLDADTNETTTVYSLILSAAFEDNTYTFYFNIKSTPASLSGAANENPTDNPGGGSDDNNGAD